MCCVFSIAGSEERGRDLQPFAVLDEASLSVQGKSVMKLAAPSLLNDYCKQRYESCKRKAYVRFLSLCFRSAVKISAFSLI